MDLHIFTLDGEMRLSRCFPASGEDGSRTIEVAGLSRGIYLVPLRGLAMNMLKRVVIY